MELWRRGRRVHLRYAVIQAVRRICGDERYAGAWQYEARRVSLESWARGASSRQMDDLAPLALWRLQRVWPTLTDTQRAGIVSLLLGGGPQAVQAAMRAYPRVNKRCIPGARKVALRRIDDPSAYSRVACRRL